MTERVEDGGLVLLDLTARDLKLGRGAIVKRSFRDPRTGKLDASTSVPAFGELESSMDTRLCRADRGEFE